MAELQTKPRRNLNFKRLDTELMFDWNGPTGPKSQAFIEKSLDRHFGGKKIGGSKLGIASFCQVWTECQVTKAVSVVWIY